MMVEQGNLENLKAGCECGRIEAVESENWAERMSGSARTCDFEGDDDDDLDFDWDDDVEPAPPEDPCDEEFMRSISVE